MIGLTYSGHSKDFSKTWSLSALYKAIPGTTGVGGAEMTIGSITIGGIGLSALVGVILNLILPKNR